MLRPMPYSNKDKYNTNNFHTYSPFIFQDNNLIVQPTFYNKIKQTWVETELIKHFDSIIIKEGVVYGKNPETSNISEEEYFNYFKVYKIYLRWYDADKWHHILNRPCSIIPYNEPEKKLLTDISKIMICGGSQTLNSSNKEDLEELIIKLDNGIKKCDMGQGCFIKLSGASTKHDFAPTPIFNGITALEHLLASKRIFKHLDCYNIMIQSWREDVSLKAEFRVFIEDNKVIGVSQQDFCNIYQEFISIYSLMCKDIVKMAQNIWDSITGQLEYTEATLDVWIDSDNEMHLIEINPYGIWQAAGASWFDWETDFPEVENIKSLNDVEVRITYPDNYFEK